MDFVESFEEVKVRLKERWLDFYEENYDWIETLGVYRDSTWNENSRIQSPYFLLGVLSALDPEFASLLKILGQLSSEPKKIAKLFDILDLNLAQELQKRAEARTQNAELMPLLPESSDLGSDSDSESEYLNPIRQDMNQQPPLA